jgi:hypothetical protein
VTSDVWPTQNVTPRNGRHSFRFINITQVQVQRQLVGLQRRAVGTTGISVTTRPCCCCCCQQAGAQPAVLLSSMSFQPFDTVGPPIFRNLRLSWPHFMSAWRNKILPLPSGTGRPSRAGWKHEICILLCLVLTVAGYCPSSKQDCAVRATSWNVNWKVCSAVVCTE